MTLINRFKLETCMEMGFPVLLKNGLKAYLDFKANNDGSIYGKLLVNGTMKALKLNKLAMAFGTQMVQVVFQKSMILLDHIMLCKKYLMLLIRLDKIK